MAVPASSTTSVSWLPVEITRSNTWRVKNAGTRNSRLITKENAAIAPISGRSSVHRPFMSGPPRVLPCNAFPGGAMPAREMHSLASREDEVRLRDGVVGAAVHPEERDRVAADGHQRVEDTG